MSQNMSSNTKEESLALAQAAANDGDQQTAWTHLNSVINFTALDKGLESELWAPAYELAAGLTESRGGFDELASLMREAAAHPIDPNVLYKLGYELIEVGMHSQAATPLLRAHRIVPDAEIIVTELSTALEEMMLNGEAARMLSEARTKGVDGPFPTYLLGFNSFLSGDAETTRQASAQLGDPEDPNLVVMANRLRSFLARHDRVRGATALDSDDLRGWHYGICGSVLTHLSEYGWESMRGRYAMIQDGEQSIREGVERLTHVLEAWNFDAKVVQFLPDRGSEIVGRAVAQRLGLEASPYYGAPMPGKLIAAYDFFDADHELLRELQQRNADEVLFTHAMCWTQGYPLTADVCTMLYQSNTAPWDARMRIDPETRQVSTTEPDDAPAAEFAARIMATPMDDEANLGDIEALRSLAAAAGKPQPGERASYFVGSPVASSRFT